ncbi:hypothetical protein F0L74_09730 [Chitinophaga agrisoli]|uniref:Uncharacterized protein n=1 Tax=Chitinophaga agrisoli TaxID=2607653 RepID=A0A5B2VW23_9BACT|nr:hypothetical protein [Chitinophaga agrisoli]KAA2242798.1 hypothetical protein F0L74_09730 [Chitinophaga agrisoli]
MSDRGITEAIQKIAGRQLTDEVYIIACTVDAVNEGERACDCIAIGGEAVTDIPGVQLMAEVDDGILYIPAIGSTVIVVYSKRNVPYIALYSELSAIRYVVGDSTIDVTEGLIKLNNGDFGGLVKVEDLVTKLNNLETLVNDFIQKYNTHVHTGVQTGAGTSAVTTAVETGSLTPTIRAELENTTVTHGE